MLVVDNFAGGGGASLGIERALGRPIDVAINHDPQAVAMHAANHPDTEHLTQDVWEVDPAEVARRGRVLLAWFSPDCTHHSKAKGGVPIRPAQERSRDLAWVVVRWAQEAAPAVIMLENVEEFADWGPLLDGRPDKGRAGETFRQWVAALREAGYEVQWRELRACDYGAPTVRRRLFVIARRDGEPIVWPEPTHGPGLPEPHRTAAECIDWSVPIYSIFLSREEGKKVGVRRPLADKTMARIARGVFRYVIDAARPFIVPVTHGGDLRVHSVDEPLRTVTTAKRGEFAVVAPWMAQHNSGMTGHDMREPVSTIVGKGSTQALVAGSLAASPFFVPRYGEREGQSPRAATVEAPMPTVVPAGNTASLVASFLSRQFGGSTGQDMDRPAPTVMPHGGGKSALVAGFLSNQHTSNAGGGQGSLSFPMNTVLAGGQHKALVQAFLVKYYGTNVGSDLLDPCPTATARARFGLVTVDSVNYELVDIGMRMLLPRELYRAQGFPDSYVIEVEFRGRKLSKSAQIRMCGNSVCPQVAMALVAANVPRQTQLELAA